MKYYIFRNNTIETFFGDENISYSGYDDISNIPNEAESYIWFYQVPFNIDRKQLSEEIETYFDKFMMIYNQIEVSKTFLAFTLVDLYSFRMTSSDYVVSKSVYLFNEKLISFAENKRNIKVIDFNEFTNLYSSIDLVNWKFYFIYQMQLNPKLVKDFKKWFSRIEDEIKLKRKKCLVLDLDNTLWGGVLGEDGIDRIKIGGDYPGKAFLYWQKSLLELNRNGIILTVCSKNNEKDVLEAWDSNPFMVLKKEHFSAYRINWTDKATNIQEIAKELNIGLDSMVFIDDNPTERELIRQVLPMVEVPDFPNYPYDLPVFYKNLVYKYFRIYNITEEDRNKTAQYKANAERAKEQTKFVDFEDYLASLKIQIDIIKANNFNKERIAQMTQKTNQFNLTTHRYSDGDIQYMMDNGWLIYCISVKDKFGDNGITGVIMITPKDSDNNVMIDSLLLSCRILGKGIEDVFVYSILNLLNDMGIRNVLASYIISLKNSQVANFYDRLGFVISSTDNKSVEYSLELKNKFVIKDYYALNFK